MKSPTCSVDGCERPSRRAGYCSPHYTRVRRHGDPQAGKPLRRERGYALELLQATYLDKSAHDPGWTYLRSDFGYGRVWRDGRMLHAHQVACELVHGPKPFHGAVVRHLCRNRACYYGPHLEWGTVAENNADMVRDGSSGAGERNASAKLTEIEVRMIRCLLEHGDFSQQAIGEVFGVDQSNVSAIRRGKSWLRGR